MFSFVCPLQLSESYKDTTVFPSRLRLVFLFLYFFPTETRLLHRRSSAETLRPRWGRILYTCYFLATSQFYLAGTIHEVREVVSCLAVFRPLGPQSFNTVSLLRTCVQKHRIYSRDKCCMRVGINVNVGIHIVCIISFQKECIYLNHGKIKIKKKK